MVTVKSVRLYVVEQQELYKDVYRSVFPDPGIIDVMSVVGSRDYSELEQDLSRINPDVLIYSAKEVDGKNLDILQEIRLVFPKIALIVASFQYHADQIRTLKKIAANSAGAGMALLLKHSLDNGEQLHAIVRSVLNGQLIIDPALTGLMFSDGNAKSILQTLTTRELEIVDLLSKGYTNSTIAERLFIDVRTVHHHINNLYSKLKGDPDFDKKNMRVSATRIYLESRGILLGGD